MAGHSKWSKIKRAKAANDSKKSKIYTKLLKEIQVASKMGGENLDGNHRLKRAVESAKAGGVPKDNIEKAVKKGSGTDESVVYEEITYEAYGPAGVGVLITSLTDNKNRTVAEVRHALSRNGGTLATSGAVSYLFSELGQISIDNTEVEEDEIFNLALENGAEDIEKGDDTWDITCLPENYNSLFDSLQKYKSVQGEIKPVASTLISLNKDDAEVMLKLMDVLDDLDDVQDVVGNFDISQEVAKELGL